LTAQSTAEPSTTLAHTCWQAFPSGATFKTKLVGRTLRSLFREGCSYAAIHTGKAPKAGAAAAVGVALSVPTAAVGANGEVILHRASGALPSQTADTGTVLAEPMVGAITHAHLQVAQLPGPTRLTVARPIFTGSIQVAVLFASPKFAILPSVGRRAFTNFVRKHTHPGTTTTACFFDRAHFPFPSGITVAPLFAQTASAMARAVNVRPTKGVLTLWALEPGFTLALPVNTVSIGGTAAGTAPGGAVLPSPPLSAPALGIVTHSMPGAIGTSASTVRHAAL
jgi:hypothetical protein